MAALRVDRRQVLAYRVAAQGLHRDAHSVNGLGVLDLGLQEAMGQPAGYAWAARLPVDAAVGPSDVAVGPGHRLALAWTLRGAPHVHRRRDLDRLAAALWPLSEADAGVRLNESGPAVRRSGVAALDQLAVVVGAMRDVVGPAGDDGIAKGAASTAVTRRIPASMRHECRGCGTAHVSDSAMRTASLPAGVELQPATAPPVLVTRGVGPVDAADPRAVADLAVAYLTYLGPATVADVAGFLGARRADLDALLREHPPAVDLVEIDVDGRVASVPADRLALLRDPPPPDPLRLLGAFDPFMQARDRSLLVPDRALHKALWPVLGRPGVVLAGGEVAGWWKAALAGTTLTVRVHPVVPLPAAQRSAVEAEAQRVAAVRGAATVRTVIVD